MLQKGQVTDVMHQAGTGSAVRCPERERGCPEWQGSREHRSFDKH